MRNYITLNGVRSDTINGLLIQTLAPITKPEVRTEIDEIDGRDGDVITRLGYKSYDKKIEIGLHGSYIVDDVIEYFVTNDSGTVTFSNEPKYYYNYDILDNIDFTRLIRYKTAELTLHVQPFKYLVGEKKHVLTASGTVKNSGNTTARPVIHLTGSGTVGVSLNSNEIFKVDLSNDTEITIDTFKLDAYNGSELKNRLVTGDISKFVLKQGENTIDFTGTVTRCEFSNYSRWI